MAPIGPDQALGIAAQLPIGNPPRKSRPKTPMMRRYTMECLTPDGSVETSQRIAPATPAFEAAFSAFARGTLIATEHGPVAVEDLEPGTRVKTAHDGLQKLLWKGSMAFLPRTPANGEPRFLTRIMADSFGLGRPMPDLLAGPGAMLFRTNPARGFVGCKAAPASDLVDGEAVCQISPATGVQLYQLVFEAPQVIWANGLECESFHPETMVHSSLCGELRTLFLSMFPHVSPPRLPHGPHLRPAVTIA